MTDAYQISALIVAALQFALPEAAKGFLNEAGKGAFSTIKAILASRGAEQLTALETDPNSMDKQRALAAVVDTLGREEIEQLQIEARIMIASLREGTSPIGVDLQRLREVEVELGGIQVSDGVGARIQDVESGILRVGNVSVGPQSGK